jgi:hypothetical protein
VKVIIIFCLIGLKTFSFSGVHREKFVFKLEVIQLSIKIIVIFQKNYVSIFTDNYYLPAFVLFSRINCFYYDKKIDMKVH